jgi:regulator of PEP synthase PpsR (kinase-PPPase family)
MVIERELIRFFELFQRSYWPMADVTQEAVSSISL